MDVLSKRRIFLEWLIDNTNYWVADGSYRLAKWSKVVKQVIEYWWIKWSNVRLYKKWFIFLWKWIKPDHNSGSISLLVDIIFSRYFSLASPNSFFSGLISVHLVLFGKLDLWYLIVIFWYTVYCNNIYYNK